MKKLRIGNFKCYKNMVEMAVSNLTVNVGKNSVGKSTMIQSILLLEQVKKCVSDGRQILLNDMDGLDLGQYKDIVSDMEKGIRLGIDEYDITLYEGDNPFSVVVDKQAILPDEFVNSELFYINAERIGPRNYQTMIDMDSRYCGVHGENTYRVLSEMGEKSIPKSRCYKDENTSIQLLRKQVEFWMSYITSSIQIIANDNPENRITSLRMRQMNVEMDPSAPYNFGFGISYTLPIIVSCLLAPKSAIILIENPEAHLHPAGQSHIGQFLAQMMEAGLRIVVETHSEHVVNGIRIYCLRNAIEPQCVCINYYDLNEIGTVVKRIEMDEKMNIISWPNGFFDQEEKDLMELRNLRKSK